MYMKSYNAIAPGITGILLVILILITHAMAWSVYPILGVAST